MPGKQRPLNASVSFSSGCSVRRSRSNFIAAFLRPPLYSLNFDRGFGTLYTAALWPQRRAVTYSWPGSEWQLTLADCREDSRLIQYVRAPF